VLIPGGGSQTDSSGRWGDYSATFVDPSDGCTFYYTNEYYLVTSANAWDTRVGSFQFPSCAATPTPTPTATPTPTPTPTPGPVQLTSVVSRATHGSAGTFDINLTGGNGIECRDGGTNYTLVLSFANTLKNVGGASVTTGTGSVAVSNIDSNNAHNYIVNLTGVANAQFITVSLSNVTDSSGNFSSAVSASMGVLIGDVNATGTVDGNDVSEVQGQTRQPVTAANFREDVNANGLIDGNDVSITQGHTRTSLPPP